MRSTRPLSNKLLSVLLFFSCFQKDGVIDYAYLDCLETFGPGAQVLTERVAHVLVNRPLNISSASAALRRLSRQPGIDLRGNLKRDLVKSSNPLENFFNILSGYRG